MKKLTVIIIGVLLFIGGITYLLQIGLPGLKRTIEGKNWPHTSGLVLESSKKENAIGAKKRSFVFKFKVEYKVEDSTYVLQRFHQSDRDSWERYAKVVEVYPRGSHIDVYYDPQNPASSNYFLERNFGMIFLLLLIPIIVIWGLGFWLLYVGLF